MPKIEASIGRIGTYLPVLRARPAQVQEKNLALGRCWARCDALTSWEVRWEGSANVDDGTAQVRSDKKAMALSRYEVLCTKVLGTMHVGLGWDAVGWVDRYV